MKVKLKLLSPNAIPPRRSTTGSAGMDIFACLENSVVIEPGKTELIPSGFSLELPDSGCAAFIYARSGLAVKHGIFPANCVGVVDSDYRGEVMVGLHNSSQNAYTVSPGERIAQMVIAPVLLPELELTGELSCSDRAGGGFGSTGKF